MRGIVQKDRIYTKKPYSCDEFFLKQSFVTGVFRIVSGQHLVTRWNTFFYFMAEVKENHKEASGQAHYVVLPLLWVGLRLETVIKIGYIGSSLTHTHGEFKHRYWFFADTKRRMNC